MLQKRQEVIAPGLENTVYTAAVTIAAFNDDMYTSQVLYPSAKRL